MSKKSLLESVKEDFEEANLPVEAKGSPGLSRTKSISNARLINIDDIIQDPSQPRKQFRQHRIDELAASIKARGVLEPLTVRFAGEEGKYVIVTGERRCRAAKTAGLTEIPCLVKEMTDEEVLISQLIENVQREDLSVLEEARSYKRLIDDHKWTQTRISVESGKSQPYISQILKILDLPGSILEDLERIAVSKNVLLILTKSENPEKMWQEIKQGRKPEDVRKEVEKEENPRGRPQNYRYRYNPKGKTFKVTVEFRKPHAENEEIRTALNETLNNLQPTLNCQE